MTGTVVGGEASLGSGSWEWTAYRQDPGAGWGGGHAVGVLGSSHSEFSHAGVPPLHTLGKLRHVLSMDGFLSYLSSKDGDIFNPTCLPIYQDMTQPLNHYYINSSHNTYLVGDQLCGQSSVEGYIRCSERKGEGAELMKRDPLWETEVC